MPTELLSPGLSSLLKNYRHPRLPVVFQQAVSRRFPLWLLFVLLIHFFSVFLFHNPAFRSTSLAASPLGILLSRWIYWKCQTDWHYGRRLSLIPNRSRALGALYLQIAPGPPWSSWLDKITEALQPTPAWAHQLAEPSRRMDKNFVVIRLIDWALMCDPTYAQLYLDKSFIEDREVNCPQKSERTLQQGLTQIHDPSQRTALLVDLIFLRSYRLRNPDSARKLQWDLREEVAEAGPNLSPEIQGAVRACLKILVPKQNSQQRGCH